MSEDTLDTPRRAVRRRTKPKKYGEFIESSPTKVVEHSNSSESDNTYEEECELQKPTALFSNDDVEGQDMFKFKSRHTKLDLQNIVKSAIGSSPKVNRSPMKTPRKSILRGSFASPGKGSPKVNRSPMKTPRKNFLRGSFASPGKGSPKGNLSPMKTPGKNFLRVSFASPGKGNEATPRYVKDILKNKIRKEIQSDSESDFSGSSSEYVPDGSDNESDTSQASGSEVEDEENQPLRKPATKMQIAKKTTTKARQKDAEYIVKPDNYFMMHSSNKIATSDHTLARLKNMNLNENTDKHSHISEEHSTKIAELHQSNETLFNKWLYALSENFNLILYGIGSKRSVLQKFQAEKLKAFPCIVVNGFFPSLTLKSILESIVIDLLENSSVPANVGDICSLIDTQLSECGADLFLIIHNIDGLMLRNAKTQAMLANISQINNVHVIATIDHINAPLLWDHSKLSKFNFTWWDVTTFAPYSVETSFETSLLSQRSGALQLSSLRSVFHSLTTNAKGIFKIIIQYQLENHKQTHYQGLPFKDLYSKSREQFLVSSDLALRAQLTEFLDHKLVKVNGGSENLLIPIDNVLLQQFLEEQDS